jgi:hypothetical protein
MKNYDNEPYLNESYYVETTRDGSQIEPRQHFSKVGPHYTARFPFPKDDAIRAFHRTARRHVLSGATVELWRETPELVLCADATFSRIGVHAKD